MSYISKILNFMYYMITEVTDNVLFQYFLYMIIILFVIRALRYMLSIC